MNKLAIQNFVRNYSIEATVPQAERIERFADTVLSGTRIYIPHTPHTDFQEIVALAVRLRREGMEPVPHIVARRIESLSVMEDFIARLSGDGGVAQVLVVAGDLGTPAGQLNSGLQILESGRTVPIVSGQQTIHSLFHLDSPSVTVVVRTQHDPGTGPQFNYLPPHVAIDPHHNDLLTMRRKQLLDVLEQVEDTGYAELVMEMIADLDFERGFSVLQHSMGYLQRLDEWAPAIKAFEKKHAVLAVGVEATLREEVRRNVIKDLRGTIIEPEHRFFLALLMNAPTRDDLLALVKQRFPKQAPIAVVLRWVQELTEVSDEGATILDACFPETLEVESEAQPDLFLSAFGHFLKRDKKLPPAMRDLPAADVKELRGAFAESALSLLTA